MLALILIVMFLMNMFFFADILTYILGNVITKNQ
jgi:hypothetical protein